MTKDIALPDPPKSIYAPLAPTLQVIIRVGDRINEVGQYSADGKYPVNTDEACKASVAYYM